MISLNIAIYIAIFWIATMELFSAEE